MWHLWICSRWSISCNRLTAQWGLVRVQIAQVCALPSARTRPSVRVVLVHARLLTGERAQLAGRSDAWQMELGWHGIRAEKTFEENGKNLGVFKFCNDHWTNWKWRKLNELGEREGRLAAINDKLMTCLHRNVWTTNINTNLKSKAALEIMEF